MSLRNRCVTSGKYPTSRWISLIRWYVRVEIVSLGTQGWVVYHTRTIRLHGDDNEMMQRANKRMQPSRHNVSDCLHIWTELSGMEIKLSFLGRHMKQLADYDGTINSDTQQRDIMRIMGKADTSDLMMIIRWVTNGFFRPLKSNQSIEHRQSIYCEEDTEGNREN